MGGGRRKFTRKEDRDPVANRFGDRIDGRDLISEWKSKMQSKNLTHSYIWNLEQFKNLKPNQYQHVLGTFIIFLFIL